MSSLQDFGNGCQQVRGLSPMATSCRRFTANRNVIKLNFAGNSIVQVEKFRNAASTRAQVYTLYRHNRWSCAKFR